MTNCPVGSIHRGSAGQMVIENWCIGCKRCADYCPYGSIKMHDVGVLPLGTLGWRLALDPPGEDWIGQRFADRNWFSGQAPFFNDRLLRERLQATADPSAPDRRLVLRIAFRVSATDCALGDSFELMGRSRAPDKTTVWLNGRAASLTHLAKLGRAKGMEYNFQATLASGGVLRPRADAPSDQPVVEAGTNVLVAQVPLPRTVDHDFLFDAGIYLMRRPAVHAENTAAYVPSLVWRQAVVCDLCSGLAGGPACVKACPHEAALRFDARGGIPKW
jgi:Fe-S-cluster-containing hydrogenase component 2